MKREIELREKTIPLITGRWVSVGKYTDNTDKDYILSFEINDDFSEKDFENTIVGKKKLKKMHRKKLKLILIG